MFIWGDFGTEQWKMEGANNHNSENKSTSTQKRNFLNIDTYRFIWKIENHH